MSDKAKKRLHLIYGVILSVLIVAVGICFMVSCVSIYRLGESPFTYESIGAHFRYIAIPTYVCLAAILGGIVISLACPLTPARLRGGAETKTAIARLSRRVDTAACDPDLMGRIRAQRTLRRVLCIVAAVLCAAMAIVCLVYLCNPVHFDMENINGDVINSMKLVLPCTAVGLAICTIVSLWGKRSLLAELALVKQAVAASPLPKDAEVPTIKTKKSLSPKAVWMIRGAIAAVAVTFIVLGVFNGGMADVLGKAIRICTECIGLG